MRKPIFAATALILVVVAACGGNVVVDGAGPGGGTSTGTLSTGGIGTTVPIGTGNSCFNLPPPSTVTLCGGSGSSGGMCSFSFCQQGSSDTWVAECAANTCECFLNGVFQCSCALVGAGNFCGGTPDCCLHAE
jgi:hypothetical protein